MSAVLGLAPGPCPSSRDESDADEESEDDGREEVLAWLAKEAASTRQKVEQETEAVLVRLEAKYGVAPPRESVLVGIATRAFEVARRRGAVNASRRACAASSTRWSASVLGGARGDAAACEILTFGAGLVVDAIDAVDIDDDGAAERDTAGDFVRAELSVDLSAVDDVVVDDDDDAETSPGDDEGDATESESDPDPDPAGGYVVGSHIEGMMGGMHTELIFSSSRQADADVGVRVGIVEENRLVELWHERAAVAHGGLERGLLQNAFRAGVDEQRELLRVLDPGRDQAPAHQYRLAVRQVGARRTRRAGERHQHRLRRRDAVAGRKLLQFRKAEKGGGLVRRGGQGKASAHGTRLVDRCCSRKVAMERCPCNR